LDIVSKLPEIIVVLVPLILSLSVHEFAHAWSAFRLGDDTAAREGRMTLNPISHIDPVGTIVFPIIGVFSGFFFGWAKPVPVAPYRFRRDITMHTGMIITALAGPVSNLLIALIAGGIAVFLYGDLLEAFVSQGASRATALLALGDFGFTGSNSRALSAAGFGRTDAIVAMIVGRLYLLNIGLAVFNMLPLPPLDGSRMLPPAMQESLARYQMVLFIGLVLAVNWLPGIVGLPITWIGNGLLALWAIIF